MDPTESLIPRVLDLFSGPGGAEYLLSRSLVLLRILTSLEVCPSSLGTMGSCMALSRLSLEMLMWRCCTSASVKVKTDLGREGEGRGCEERGGVGERRERNKHEI